MWKFSLQQRKQQGKEVSVCNTVLQMQFIRWLQSHNNKRTSEWYGIDIAKFPEVAGPVNNAQTQ
jgi:hypothetical protein